MEVEDLSKNREMEGIVYVCVWCGKDVPLKQLELRGGSIRCIHCSFRVLKKKRPSIVRRIRAV
jgi:DNA-directed RNA polymerase subunit RPC12/RpoP